MSKKSHIGLHDIELYLQEKLDINELEAKKNHYVEELLDLKRDCDLYQNDSEEVYLLEKKLYCERLKKNEDLLKDLILIFPKDNNLKKILEDL